ncbi:MAG: hypothetical protein A2787_08980 [Omnitrophica WOR_2 bacterium RIFCSPHIGHO2_01_FULL_48_9]|nr:MAG: hypothetical protein A3D10_07265 [Omnitrophica WOR_2 bacterium RIFCSPHIGHO2_02_FULL_48_11]OGX31858.1 MAG: hypothetical protein A2787_08980 [Omnitrophica WOR_2 bacterium RIFCSPHIGHO2_01_FULL_48_9]
MGEKTKQFYGLVLTGGKSKRLGQDKAVLNLSGKPQAEYAYELLLPFCEKVFVSCRPDQAQLPGRKNFPQIIDRPEYSDIGPLAGILSAMQEHPNQVWIVLACDLPFVTPATIRNLISQRNPQKFATAYISTHDGLPEPLCAIYEPQDYQNILQFLKENIHCPRKIMIKSDTELVEQADPQSLENINTPEELKKWVKK